MESGEGRNDLPGIASFMDDIGAHRAHEGEHDRYRNRGPSLMANRLVAEALGVPENGSGDIDPREAFSGPLRDGCFGGRKRRRREKAEERERDTLGPFGHSNPLTPPTSDDEGVKGCHSATSRQVLRQLYRTIYDNALSAGDSNRGLRPSYHAPSVHQTDAFSRSEYFEGMASAPGPSTEPLMPWENTDGSVPVTLLGGVIETGQSVRRRAALQSLRESISRIKSL